MAFTKTPATSTYQTKTIKLMKELDHRAPDSTKDVDFLNVYFEPIKNKLTQENDYNIVKRQGVSSWSSSFTFTNSRGFHYWEVPSVILLALDNDIYVVDAVLGTTTTILSNVFSTTSGHVGFCEFLYDNGDVKICATDGDDLITIDTSWTVVTGSDADMPTPHKPYPVFLDGYLFLAKSGTADIYNSNLNDPLTYTSGDFISAEMFGDDITYIAQLNNYLLAFGNHSIEYFWDAANTSGSPLQRNDTPVKLTGYLGAHAQTSNQLFFVGNTSTGTPAVYLLEDFKIKEVSDEAVRKYLESLTETFIELHGSIISFDGHDFYVLNAGTGATYVYDLKYQLWTRWAYQDGTNFRIKFAKAVNRNSGASSYIFIENASTILRFDKALYQDNAVDFTVRIVTDREMFDTYNQKTMSRLVVDTDKPTATSTLAISWSDDDYQTFTTPRTVDLYQELPSLTRLGRFRRRVFKLEFEDNQPLRVKKLEVDINIGQS